MAIFTRSDRQSGTGPLAPTAGGGKRGLFSIIGPDMVIMGNVTATADLHIEGRVDGDVACGILVQGIDSRITGAVKADSARLAGSVEGSVAVRHLTIDRAARITGDVEYETITIETGASVDGRLKHLGADTEAVAFEHVAQIPDSDLVQITATGQAA